MSSNSLFAKSLSLLLTFALVLPSSLAFAGPEQAREYFKQAKTAYGNGEFEKAATLLEKAYAEEANLTYQYNRIRALEGAEKYEEALEVLKTYERPMLDAKGFEDVPQLKKSLQAKVGDTSDDAGAETTEKTDEAADDGSEETSKTAENTTDETPDDDTKTGEADNSGTMKAVGFTLLGVGVASAGAAGYFGSYLPYEEPLRSKVKNSSEPRLTSDEKKTVNTNQALTVTFMAVSAGTLIGGGVILLQTMGGGGDKDVPASASNTKPKVHVAPFVGRESGGAVLDVRF